MLRCVDDPVRDVVTETTAGDLADGLGQDLAGQIGPLRRLDFGLEMAHVLEEKHRRRERAHEEHVLVQQAIAHVARLGVRLNVYLLLPQTADLPAPDPTEALTRRPTQHDGYVAVLVSVQIDQGRMRPLVKHQHAERLPFGLPLKPDGTDAAHHRLFEQRHEGSDSRR